MHAEDGMNDKDIEDRKGGDEPKTMARPSNEENEKMEGEKEFKGREM
jgi:hypothetical protein